MKAIKNMKDALEFVASFDEGNVWIFSDSTISMPNGGSTEIRKHNEQFYQFSSGQNWSDQQEEHIPNIPSFVWKHRADIRCGEWSR